MKNNLLIYFLISAIAVQASDSLIASLDVKTSYFTTDHLSNLYFINDKSEIIKYNVETADLLSYSNKQLGTPTYIDAANPFKILAFYPDFNSLVLLDNKLAELTILRLNITVDENNYLPSAICRERESDFIWIYDQLSRKLIKLDERGNKIVESEAFDQMFSDTISPRQIVCAKQNFFLLDQSGRILIFDAFANFHTALNYDIQSNMQITDDSYIFVSNDSASVISRDLYSGDKYRLPFHNVLQINIQNNLLFLRLENAIHIIAYKMN